MELRGTSTTSPVIGVTGMMQTQKNIWTKNISNIWTQKYFKYLDPKIFQIFGLKSILITWPQKYFRYLQE